MRRMLIIGILFLTLGATPKAQTVPNQKADLVLRHGRIYTMDASRSWAESVAIHNGRIVYVGDDNGISNWVGPETKTVELGGRFVMPGFIDSHVHPISSGVELLRADLLDAETKEEILEVVKTYAAKNPKEPWIIGNGWPLPAFPQANPQKEWLDEIVSDRPVFLWAADGHSSWANSKALQIAGITKDTPDPENGRIERNEKGEPSGTLRESASQLVNKFAPKLTMEQQMEGLKSALKLMAETGITGFLDASVTASLSEEQKNNGTAWDMDIYREADKRGFLTAHGRGAMYADPDGTVPEVLKQIPAFKKSRAEVRSVHFETGAIKIFADGVIEANTAAVLTPYVDTKTSGTLNWAPEKLNAFVELADKEKFQIHVHAIGDAGVRGALDAFEKARRKNGIRDSRGTIAHLELIDPVDIRRFAPLGVIACFQPLWAYADSYINDLTLPKLEKSRARWIYPMESVDQTGAVLAMGSDWSVSSINPLEGIEVAVLRKDPEGAEGGPFIPEERITLREALAAYTIGSAYANYWEEKAGSIETGKSADLIVLSKNLFEIPLEELSEIKVEQTYFEGKIIFGQ